MKRMIKIIMVSFNEIFYNSEINKVICNMYIFFNIIVDDYVYMVLCIRSFKTYKVLLYYVYE